ncbi:uncharacterized protein METZ01_LOCUS458557 [marine metagenome]|uniref:Uncharacterized protein n=1 Tax=marine metagenome TaxID=408172 RepID=A0A383ADN4_9ZZZZ
MTKEKSPLKWKFKTGGCVEKSPAVSDGIDKSIPKFFTH